MREPLLEGPSSPASIPTTVCYLSLRMWYFSFFLGGEGGVEGGESKILSQRPENVRLEKGKETGKAKVLPFYGGAVWGQALNIFLLQNLLL